MMVVVSAKAQESDLDDYYVAAAAAQGRGIVFDDDNSDGWFFRSDHYNFVKKGVKAIVVENDVKPEWYHKPSDEYRDDWDLSGTLANTNMMFSVCLSLASADSSAACGASAASGSSAPDSPSARSSRSAARRDPSQPQH